MENTLTLSQLADLIIVGGSISITFGIMVYLIADIIFDLIDIAKMKREIRKENEKKEQVKQA